MFACFAHIFTCFFKEFACETLTSARIPKYIVVKYPKGRTSLYDSMRRSDRCPVYMGVCVCVCVCVCVFMHFIMSIQALHEHT